MKGPGEMTNDELKNLPHSAAIVLASESAGWALGLPIAS